MNTEKLKEKQRIEKILNISNLAMNAYADCVESFEETEINEDEEECLKKSTLKHYYATNQNPLENFIFTNYPKV